MESPDLQFIIDSRELLCQLTENREARLAVKMIDNGSVKKLTEKEILVFKTCIVKWRDMQPQEPIDLVSDDEESVEPADPARLSPAVSNPEFRYMHLLRRKSCGKSQTIHWSATIVFISVFLCIFSDRMVVAESRLDDILTPAPTIDENSTPESSSNSSVNDVSLHSLIDLKRSRPVQKRKSEEELQPMRRALMNDPLPSTSSKPLARKSVGLEGIKTKRKLESGAESTARKLFTKPHSIRKSSIPSSSKAHQTNSLSSESSRFRSKSPISAKRALQTRSAEKRREYSDLKRFKSSTSSPKTKASSKERLATSSSPKNEANAKKNVCPTEYQLHSARLSIRSAVDLLQPSLTFENRELLTLKLFEWARDGQNIITDLRERLSDDKSPRYSRERSLSRPKEVADDHQFAVPEPVDRIQTATDRSRKKPAETSDERNLRSQMPSASGMITRLSFLSEFLNRIRFLGLQDSAPNRPTSDAVAVPAAAPVAPAKSSKRNDDKRIYYANEEYRQKKCVLCGVSNRLSMVSHYVTKHPKDEVFISRLSPAFAKRAKSTPLEPTFNEKMEIRAICYFCESEKTMRTTGWAAHIMTHTGERDYFCKPHGAVTFNHRCIEEKTKIFDYDFVDDLLSGFMCKECNYVQVQEKNLIKHIKTTHNHRLGYFDKFYQEIHFVSKQMCPPLSAAAVKEETSYDGERGSSQEPDRPLDANKPDRLDQPDESGSRSDYTFSSSPVHMEMSIHPYDIKMEDLEEDAQIRIGNNLNESNESLSQSAYAALLDRSILSESLTTSGA